MNTHDAKTLPLNVLLGYLTSLYEDWDCTCDCQYETLLDNNHRDLNKPAVIYSKYAAEYAERQREECKKDGCSCGWRSWETETPYEDCPERIAYERIKVVLDKETPRQVIDPIKEWICPTCDNHIIGIQGNYCPICGQRLEW